jgi:FlaA1/EpsC-like NDP-sugar epimerase
MQFVKSLNLTGMRSLHLGRLRFTARALQVSIEIFLLTISFALAYLLRFDFDIPPSELSRFATQVFIVVAIQLVALRSFGAHRFIWRYTSTRDTRVIAAALASVGGLLLVVRSLHAFFPEALIVPMSIAILDSIVAFVSVVGVRLVRREIYEYSNRSRDDSAPRKRVILVGAGQAGVLTLAEIKRRGDIDIDVRAFVDDDVSKHGAVINGIRVLGSTDDLSDLVGKLEIDHVIISIAQATRNDFQKILKACQAIPVKVRTIPGLFELLQGNVTVSRIRNIEIDDLLGRETVSIGHEGLADFLEGKTVMVTGAGGSIGSELVRQLSRSGIKKIVLVERSEPALFLIGQEILNISPAGNAAAVVADVSDVQRMTNIFSRFRPEIVFHAAAHKHVPLMESNAPEALKNNVLGTKIVAEQAGLHGAEAFVLISSDKAVSPTSVMGATKRLAELVIQHMDRIYDTRFVAVRFGNVIGSSGSVIPTFRDQIKRGGPVTVTHPEMTRYFMTIPEATQLVLQAGAIGSGGEIMILDMGEPVKILDLARETIKLSGLRPDVDIQIKFIGMRPGEKLAESLGYDTEKLMKTVHPKIFVGTMSAYPGFKVQEILNGIPMLCLSDDSDKAKRQISRWLPECRLTIKAEVGQPIMRKFETPRSRSVAV